MAKPPLLLLHGALGSKDQFDDLIPSLEDSFEVHRFSFEGHGEAGPSDRPFRMDYFVENARAYLEEHDISKANLFGYSMGGYVALLMAQKYPEQVRKVATLGTILRWSEAVADRECGFLHPEKIKGKVPHFAESLARRHPTGWQQVVEETREMLQHLGSQPPLGESDWKHFNTPIRLHIGDRDSTAGLASTVAVYEEMESAELSVLPGTPHPFQKIKKPVLTASLTDFFLG